MSMIPHREFPPVGQGPAAGSRLNQLLDQVRSEFEGQLRATDTLEHQIRAQVDEMQVIREKVYSMEQNHLSLKAKYEEELQLLRRQLSEQQARGGIPQHGMGGPPQHGGPVQGPPPNIPMNNNNLFNQVINGQPPQPQEQQPPQQQQQPPPQQQHPPNPPPLHPPGGLQGPPPPPPPPSQQPPFQGGYSQGPPGFPGPQPPPQSTASPGPGKRPIGRPPGAPGGPATPINAPIPYSNPAHSPQVTSHQTPEHARMQGQVVAGPGVGNALGDLDPERLPAQMKKTRDDWWVIWNSSVGRTLDVDLVHTLAHDSVVCCVRFSADGKYVATGCNRSAQIYDVQSGEKICVLTDESVDHTGDLYIRSVCFSPDGKYLATGAEDKLIRVWDIASRTIRNTFAGHEQDIYSLDFARDGRTIASGSGDRTVRLWDIETKANVLVLSIEDGVTTVAVSPDTKYVAAGSLDKSVRVWDVQAGYLIERLEGADGHRDSVYSVAFSPDGKDLVSGSLDKTIKMWELSVPRGLPTNPKGGRCVRTFEGHKDFVLSVALTPDNQWVISGSKDRGVQFWDPTTGATQLLLNGHKNSVISVAPSPTGGYFATGSGDQRARIWTYRPMR